MKLNLNVSKPRKEKDVKAVSGVVLRKPIFGIGNKPDPFPTRNGAKAGFLLFNVWACRFGQIPLGELRGEEI